MDTLNMFVKNEDALFRTPSYAEEQLANAEKPKKDMINHPPHYTQGEIECIEVIKYIWRCNFKNGWEDIDKAIFYLNELLTEQQKDD